MSGYVLHLPEDESVVLSGPVSRRLIEGGDGDAALLYIAVLKNHGSIDDGRLRALLSWPPASSGPWGSWSGRASWHCPDRGMPHRRLRPPRRRRTSGRSTPGPTWPERWRGRSSPD